MCTWKLVQTFGMVPGPFQCAKIDTARTHKTQLHLLASCCIPLQAITLSCSSSAMVLAMYTVLSVLVIRFEANSVLHVQQTVQTNRSAAQAVQGTFLQYMHVLASPRQVRATCRHFAFVWGFQCCPN